MELNVSNLCYYFVTDCLTDEEIKGVLPEKLALDLLVHFIKTHDKQHIDCGLIYVEPTNISTDKNLVIEYRQDDWAVWCNYNNEPITISNYDISGNSRECVDTIRNAILK